MSIRFYFTDNALISNFILNPKTGDTFQDDHTNFTLPLSNKELIPSVQNQGFTMDNKINILILDDEDTLLEIYTSILRKCIHGPLSISTTYDGDDALLKIREASEPFDLFITDIRHPGMFCFDLIEILRKEFPSTKILITSAFGEIPDKEKYAQPDVFLHKPVEVKEFIEVINRLLGI
jgi:CheY-like chemotaxis protein